MGYGNLSMCHENKSNTKSILRLNCEVNTKKQNADINLRNEKDGKKKEEE